MSEKIKLFELDIDINSLTTSAAKTMREIKSLTERQKELKKSTNELNKEIQGYQAQLKNPAIKNNASEIDRLNKLISDSRAKYNAQTEALSKNNAEMKQARQRYNAGIKMISAYTEKEKRNLQIISKTNGSIDQLSAALSKNRAVYRSLSKDERENSEVGGKLLKLIQAQDKEYKKLQVEMGNTQVMVGTYKDSIKEAFSEMDFFNKGLQDLVGQIPFVGKALEGIVAQLSEYIAMQKASAAATEGTGKSLKLFKIALISTGIGAIVVALGTLVAAFLSTQEGIDKVNQVLKPFGVILQRLWGVLQKVGTAMVDTFTHPKKAISELWDFIKSHLINQVTGIIDTFKYVGKAINAALHLDWEGVKENAAKVGESALQAATGVDNLTGKIKNAAKETGKFLSDSWKIGKDLADLTIKIEETENEMIVKRSMLNAEFEKQKEIAQDITKTDEERRVAAQKAIDIQNELLNDEQALLDMKIKKKRAELALNDTDREAQKELNELVAKRADFEAQAARKRVSAMNLEKTIYTQIRAKQVAAAKKSIELALKESKTKLDIYIAENKDRAKTLDDQLNYERNIHNEKIELLKQELKAKKITQDEYDLAIIEAKNELTQREAEITVSHLQKELDLYIAQHQSKLDEDKTFTAESVRLEENRLYAIYNKQKEFIEKQHEEGLLAEEEYQLQLLQLKQGYLQQKQELTDEVDNQYKEKKQVDFDNELEIERLQGVNKFEIKRQQLEADYKAEIKAAKKSGADTTLIDKKYALLRKEINRLETEAKIQAIGSVAGQLADLVGRETTVGKAAAVVQATMNTYVGASKALAELPPPMSYIAAGLTIAQGLMQVSKITGINTSSVESEADSLKTTSNKGRAEHGLVIDIGGNRHSSGGTKFYGEDGTYFEAEKDEKLFVLNRLASKALGPSLSRLNILSGGRPLWQTSGYLAAGGAVARNNISSTAVKVEGMGIDYEKQSSLIAEKTGAVLGEKLKDLPRPVTDVKDIIREVDNYNEVVDGANI